MAATDGTDARVLAGAFVLSACALCVIGLVALPGTPFDFGGSALLPLLLGALGFLVMMTVVDPVLTPKGTPSRVPSRTEVHIWLSKTFMARLPAIELPVVAALLIAFVDQERSVLLLGTLGSLVLSMLWWPGEQYFNAMRRRLQPMSADKHLDALLIEANGRLFLRTR